MYVMAGDGLNLRSEPSVRSRIICALPFLTKVIIIDKDDNFVIIDGIKSQWYKVNIENNTGWLFGGYLSKNIDIPRKDGKDFIAVYRFKNIEFNGFGFENIIKRLKKSFLVIYEATGNKRYIYDDEGLIDEVPRFGDGVGGSDIVVTDIYKYPWSPSEDNRNLHETIQINIQSNRSDSGKIIYKYNILIFYEKIEL
jgi:hypothetical protein